MACEWLAEGFLGPDQRFSDPLLPRAAAGLAQGAAGGVVLVHGAAMFAWGWR